MIFENEWQKHRHVQLTKSSQLAWQHPTSLDTILPFTNILMKPLPVLITQITKIFGEAVKMTVQEVKLNIHV